MSSLLSSSPCRQDEARPLNRVLLGQPNNDLSLIAFVNQRYDALQESRLSRVHPLVKLQAFKKNVMERTKLHEVEACIHSQS
jgi:hypothetical protein